MITVLTDHPIAVDSVDHKYPRGTKNDNSTNAEFVRKVMELYPAVNLLDLGCSGGRFVRDINEAGGFSIGIEGSDYSQKRKRAEWATIPHHLFTADITEPFRVSMVRGDGFIAGISSFDIVTLWDVLEHIPEGRLDDVFANVRRHLRSDGLLIVSIATIGDTWRGREYHATVRDVDWWMHRICSYGFVWDSAIHAAFGDEWVRSGSHTVDGVFVKQ